MQQVLEQAARQVSVALLRVSVPALGPGDVPPPPSLGAAGRSLRILLCGFGCLGFRLRLCYFPTKTVSKTVSERLAGYR